MGSFGQRARQKGKIGIALSTVATVTSHTHGNKTLLDGYSYTNTQIGDAVDASAFAYTVSNISSDTPYGVGSYLISVDCTGGNVLVTLPSAAISSTYQYVITKTDSSANVVNIASVSLLAGEATQQLLVEQESLTFFSNGVNWMVR